MSISAIGAASPYLPLQQVSATQASPAKKDPDKDGDVDGAGPDKDTQASPPGSGVNILA